jgi:L-alanine-DL-glutamate epimerase-like enolase superfamily enzyme
MSSGNVRIQELRFRELVVPFKVSFRHAAAERTETSTVWIEAIASDGSFGCGESCPRPYVTNETVASAREFFALHERALRTEVVSLSTLRLWIDEHRAAIDANPAAWCAIELALLDLIGRHRGQPVETVLGHEPLAGRFSYTAVLGDAAPAAVAALAKRYYDLGFRDFKIKLSGEAVHDREKLSVFRGWPDLRVRGDANNAWRDAEAAIASLRALDFPFFALEEPIARGQYDELARVSQALACPIVLDESFVRVEELACAGAPASQWILNVRVSKMGGLIRALRVVDAAIPRRLRIIVGAQVGETSLLTRAALTVARAAGPLLTGQEGAFGTHLLERDVCDPPLMFGAGGLIDVSQYPALRAPGLGLAIVRSG